jgi:hypothetical protein
MGWDKYSGFPANRDDDNAAVAAFLESNKAKKLRMVDKSFKTKPISKTARFVFSNEERLTEE